MAQHHTTRAVEPTTGRRRRRHTALLGTALAAAFVAIAQPAEAAKPYPIDGGGMGTYTVDAASATVAGSFTGKPFDGTYAGSFAADDGTLPAPGECEPGTATLRVDGSRDRFVEMTAAGNVCGKYTSATYVVTHVFTGRYVVDASSSRRFVGSDGFMSQLIANNGNANVFVIATD